MTEFACRMVQHTLRVLNISSEIDNFFKLLAMSYAYLTAVSLRSNQNHINIKSCYYTFLFAVQLHVVSCKGI